MSDGAATLPPEANGRVRVDIHTDDDRARAQFEREIREGLTSVPKELSPKHFYDDRGSRLFEAITELHEYYPTRAERSILEARSAEIVAAAGGPVELVELGSGSSAKTRVLLDAMAAAGSLRRIVPVDISEEITRETAVALAAEYPGADMHGVVCDLERDLERIPAPLGPRIVAFLGGTIGNYTPQDRIAFLQRLRSLLGPADHLLLGTDLVKDRERLEAAYDDAAGVTAEFNRNVLHVMNRELSADFEPSGFDHVARWDPEHERIDIRLRAREGQDVHLADLDLDVHFDAGEEMRTELSCKFTQPRLEDVYAQAGLRLDGWFTDDDGLYALSLATPA